MSLIKKSNELVIPTTVKMMIYGQAGMGKSTVALSAPKPLLLDFDNGVKRMNMAHLENIDTVQVTSWSDVQQVLQEDLSAYQTIVVDTAPILDRRLAATTFISNDEIHHLTDCINYNGLISIQILLQDLLNITP